MERVGAAELEAEVKDLSMPVDFGLETMNTSSTGIVMFPSKSFAARASARYRSMRHSQEDRTDAQ